MEIVISSEVQKIMDKRGITKEDIEEVIRRAEENKTFLIAEDKSILAKHRMENFCPYVSYAKQGDEYVIKTAYAHRVLLGCEFE